MRPRTIAAALGLLALVLSAPAAAQRLCTGPVSPTCVGVETTYETERTEKRCRRDLEDYSEAVQGYVQCLRKKADRKEAEAEELRRRFECKVEGGTDC